ncbi:MAG: hypothetical protein WA747_06935 [Steroidobacteraceae bacterium]
MYEVLRKLGVDAKPTRAVEWAYAAKDGAVVVSAWHDQIRQDPREGTYYHIPTSKWRRNGIQRQRADQMRVLLGANSGKRCRIPAIREGGVTERAPFSAACPTCGQDRLMAGLTNEELEQLLDAGAEIEAYCVSCDEHWVVATEDRADMARALELLKKRR